ALREAGREPSSATAFPCPETARAAALPTPAAKPTLRAIVPVTLPATPVAVRTACSVRPEAAWRVVFIAVCLATSFMALVAMFWNCCDSAPHHSMGSTTPPAAAAGAAPLRAAAFFLTWGAGGATDTGGASAAAAAVTEDAP